jgi:hypothetical protein
MLNVENFVSATYFRSPDGSYFIQIHSFDENGVEVVKVNTVVDIGIGFVRKKIDHRFGVVDGYWANSFECSWR